MLLIECPWCGPRAESEFSCGGEADIARPLETEKITEHREQWLHTQGCRRWFIAQRDTVTYEIQGYQTFGTPTHSAQDAQEGKDK